MGYKVKECQRCGVLVDIHEKCRRCEILIHEENEEYKDAGGVQHGLKGEYGKCKSCSRK